MNIFEKSGAQEAQCSYEVVAALEHVCRNIKVSLCTARAKNEEWGVFRHQILSESKQDKNIEIILLNLRLILIIALRQRMGQCLEV